MGSPRRRALIRCGALCACFALSVVASAVPAAEVLLKPLKVSEHAYYVQGEAGVASAANAGFNSNAGFVVTNEGVVVVDALGTPALGEALVRAIRSVTDQPIRRVILTHYHADHFYGLQAFTAIGAEVWAHREGREYLASDDAGRRLSERRLMLYPWVNQSTRLVAADRWLDSDTSFAMGGLHFDVVWMGPAHSPEDVIVVVREDRVIYSGDIIFAGRVPFVGEADSKRWLGAIDRLLALRPKVMITGHGTASTDAAGDLQLTREYLVYLRETMGRAVADFVPFDEAYRQADWSRFAKVPAFDAANRINAFGTYLLLERELLAK